MTDSMIKYQTTFEATNNLPMVLALGHGENADLIASITDNGVEVDLTDFTVRAIYQPKSKWGTDDWYECPCEKSNNTIITHWGNLYDNGDNAVILWIYCMKDGELAYPALYKIRLFETPGFAPNPITPIPETLDFSQYTLVNAPWVLPADVPYPIVEIFADNTRDEYVVEIRSRHLYGIHPLISFTVGFAFDLVLVQGEMFECILDIDNRGDTEPLSFDMSYKYQWSAVVDEGVDISTLATPPNTLRRYYIKQIGVSTNNKPTLQISFDDMIMLSH